MNADSFRIASVQAASVFLNLDATIEKACRIGEAAAQGGSLVVFPEAFVAGTRCGCGSCRRGRRTSSARSTPTS
jgi:predicted amidohydrolase